MENVLLELKKADPVLEKIIDQIPFPAVEATTYVFHDLMSCILEQQIHYRSTKKTFAKLLEKASIEILSPENFEELEEKALKDFKLSANKEKTILNTLEFFQAQDLDWQEMSDVEVRKALSGIKGIGKWTIDMVLIYSLNRENIFTAEDYHLKKIMPALYGLDPKKGLTREMKAIAEKWSPYKSIGFKYLVAWKASKKQLSR